MSLNGNLEDLPLLDIIQIVSFSKKTGYLTISTPEGDGAIVFEDGYVIAAFTWDSLPVDPRAASLPADKRTMLLRNRIELALEQMIRLREGPFRFSLTEEAPQRVGDRDLAPETLEPGLNAQELLLDLARGMDEDRRDSSAALEASFAAPSEEAFVPAPALPEAVSAGLSDEADEISAEEAANRAVAAFAKKIAPVEPPGAPSPRTIPVVVPPDASREPAPSFTPPPDLRTVLLVDDEDDVREILAERFTAAGYDVVDAEDPDSAVKQAGRLGKDGVAFVLVTDLGMPTSGGSSFQGGFEVVKRLWKMKIEPPVLMMTESLSAALRARARQMSISSFVFKPGLSKLDRPQFEADLRAFAAKIVDDILPELTKPRGAPRRAKPKLEAPGDAGGRTAPAPTVEELSRQFDLLHRRLEELRRPQDATQISVLVMTVAREFFERAILFLVKNEEARGLGGFGSAPREESLNLLVREVMIPLSEPSVFLDVVSRRKTFSGPLPDGKWKNYLFGKIGRFKSETVSLLPLLTHRETIAVLYGDNPETGREFGRLDGLEVFINQAGIALENAFLQRKVQALQQNA